MLNRIRVRHFRCLKDIAVELRPLTVLIGENDTGKSAFLGSVQALFSAKSISLLDHWRLDFDNLVRLEARSGQGRYHLAAQPLAPGHRAVRPSLAEGQMFADASQRDRMSEEGATRRDYKLSCGPPGTPVPHVESFNLANSGPPMRSPGRPDSDEAPKLGAAGDGLPTLVDYLVRQDRARFDRFVDAMCRRVPGLCEINPGHPDAATRRLDLKVEGGLVIPAEKASAGVRLMLFFVALAFHPDPPDIILLEEPENGVHPKRLADIVSLLREITKGAQGGHPAQVILTTHSPYLLDHVDLAQDQVLVFRRNDDGSRTAEPVNADRLKTFLEDFKLGEVWFNEQEDGLTKRGE